MKHLDMIWRKWMHGKWRILWSDGCDVNSIEVTFGIWHSEVNFEKRTISNVQQYADNLSSNEALTHFSAQDIMKVKVFYFKKFSSEFLYIGSYTSYHIIIFSMIFANSFYSKISLINFEKCSILIWFTPVVIVVPDPTKIIGFFFESVWESCLANS